MSKKQLEYTELLKAEAILNSERSVLEHRERTHIEKLNQTIMKDIEHFKLIGRSVLQKRYPDWSTHDSFKRSEILGHYAWIMQPTKIKRIDDQTIVLTVSKRKGLGREDSYEIELSRSILSLSDRDFSKRVRDRMTAWKEEQVRLSAKELKKQIALAEKELEAANAKLQKLQRKSS